MDSKPIIYSGIQPTGCMTIGNYIGAVSNWIKMQDECNSIFSIVDLHALTVRQNPTEFRARALSFFAQYLALGLDPKKSILYYQSHVTEHAELAWILNCFTYIGELSRMTQFKEKSAAHTDNLNIGLMAYPVLMASDILLYQTSLVPVGVDQKQHLELARDVAARFNNAYSPTFTIPEPLIPTQGAKIASLQNPLAKMSKSDPDESATIALIDDEDAIMRKFRRAVTDSDTLVCASEDKPGITNLLTIMSAVTDKPISALEIEYGDRGYGVFKQAVGEAVVAKLAPVRTEYLKLMSDKAYLASVAKDGAERARKIARKTLSKVCHKIGLTER